MSSAKTEMTSPPLPTDVAGAEALLIRHKQHKSEIDARKTSFEGLKTRAQEMTDQNHYDAENIRTRIPELEELTADLHSTWEARNTVGSCLCTVSIKLFMRLCVMFWCIVAQVMLS